MVRVLLIEDNKIVCKGLSSYLVNEEFSVVGVANSGVEGLELYHACRPNVVVLDLHMPGVSGMQVAKKLLTKGVSAKIVIFSSIINKFCLSRLMSLGVKGFVEKGAYFDEVKQAIFSCTEGKTYLCQKFQAMKREIEEVHHIAHEAKSSPFSVLSDKEFDIAWMLSYLYDLSEIAASLEVKEKTVANIRSIILKKLGIRTLDELLVMAVRGGLYPNVREKKSLKRDD